MQFSSPYGVTYVLIIRRTIFKTIRWIYMTSYRYSHNAMLIHKQILDNLLIELNVLLNSDQFKNY